MPTPLRNASPRPVSTPAEAAPTFVELPMDRPAAERLFQLASQGAVLQKVPDWSPSLPADQKFGRVQLRSVAGTTYAVMQPIGQQADQDKVFLERRIADPRKPGAQVIQYRGPVSLAAAEARAAKPFDAQQAAKNLDSVRGPLTQATQALGAAIGTLPAAQAASVRQALSELQTASGALGPPVAAGWGPRAAAPSGLASIGRALQAAKADLAAQQRTAPAGTPLSSSIATALASLERAMAKLPA